MYEKVKKYKKRPLYIACVLIVIIAAVGYLLCRHHDRAAGNGGNAAVTIQQIKDDNQSARDDIKSAGDKIRESAADIDGTITRIDDSLQSIERIQKSTAENTREIDDCRNLVGEGRRNLEEASRILRDIDKENQINGTQDESR